MPVPAGASLSTSLVTAGACRLSVTGGVALLVAANVLLVLSRVGPKGEDQYKPTLEEQEDET